MKQQLAALILAAGLMLWAPPVSARTGAEGVTLSASGGDTAVTLSLPDCAGQQVTSLQMSFAVEGGAVEFVFVNTLPATVREYRYRDGVLSLYLSGREELLGADGRVHLGRIRLRDTQADATVTFAPDSLRLLNAASGVVQTADLPEVSASLPADEGEKTPAAPQPTPQLTPIPDYMTGTQAPDVVPATGGASARPIATRRPGAVQDDGTPGPEATSRPGAEPTATSAPQAASPGIGEQISATAETAAPLSTPKQPPLLPLVAGAAGATVLLALGLLRLRR